jgi:hypothetical protein
MSRYQFFQENMQGSEQVQSIIQLMGQTMMTNNCGPNNLLDLPQKMPRTVLPWKSMDNGGKTYYTMETSCGSNTTKRET